jgi:hypothetical protein
MEELKLPRHVIEKFEKRWARKLQQVRAGSQRSPARSKAPKSQPRFQGEEGGFDPARPTALGK